MHESVAENLGQYMGQVARHILGEPNAALSSKRELRYGTHGSLSVDLEKGTWFDHETMEGGGVLKFIEHELKLANGSSVAWMQKELGISLETSAKQPIAAYDYADENGEILFQVVRFEPKTFRQRRPNGKGGWDWSMDGVRRVPYHLPQLLAANDRTIHIVEGEKDVESLERHGCVATTNPGGAGKWPADFAQFFKGADVVILPDNDDVGEKHARDVARNLKPVAARCRIVKLPGLPPKGDVTRWLQDGGKIEQIEALPELGAVPPAFKLVTASEIMAKTFRAPKWAIPEIVPEGLTLLAGKPKTGKSWLSLDYAISIASGGSAMCNLKCDPGEVLMLALEDTERRLNGRMRAVLQGDKAPASLSIATEWRRMDEGGLDDLDLWMGQHAATARAVIIDTLQKIRGQRKKDDGIYADDYKVTGALKALADKHTIPVIAIHHLNKEGNSDPLMAVSGTAGITGSADTIIVLQREPNDPHAVLYVRGRDVNEAEIALQFDNETGKWLRLGKEQDWRVSEERRAIIQLLIEEGGAMHPKEIAYSLGKKPQTIRSTLARMVRDGDITKLKDGRYSP